MAAVLLTVAVKMMELPNVDELAEEVTPVDVEALFTICPPDRVLLRLVE